MRKSPRLPKHIEKVSEAGSLRCTRCGATFYTMAIGPTALQRAKDHVCA